MDRPLVTRHGRESTRHMGYLTTRAAWGPLSRAQTLRKDRCLVPVKLPGDPPFAGASSSSHPAHVSRSASLSQSHHSLMWIGDLISMASTRSQPIAHGYPHASIFESGFQFSNPPNPSDASLFGRAARFNLSAMDGRRLQAPPFVDQPLPPAYAAELSGDGEIVDSDDDGLPADGLPSVRRILASPKQKTTSATD